MCVPHDNIINNHSNMMRDGGDEGVKDHDGGICNEGKSNSDGANDNSTASEQAESLYLVTVVGKAGIFSRRGPCRPTLSSRGRFASTLSCSPSSILGVLTVKWKLNRL